MRAWLGRHSGWVAILLVGAFALPVAGYLGDLRSNAEHALRPVEIQDSI